MKLVSEIPFPKESPFVTESNRIESFCSRLKHALNVENQSLYSIQYVSIDENGVIQKSKYIIERQDILTLQWMSVCNVFCECTKNIQIDKWQGVQLDANEIVGINRIAAMEIAKREDYFGRHLEFFAKRIPESLIGLTIEQGLDKLKALGYC